MKKRWTKRKTMEERVEEHNRNREMFYPKEAHQKWLCDDRGRITSTCCDSTWVLEQQTAQSQSTSCTHCGTHRDDFKVEPCYSCGMPLDGIVGYDYTVRVSPEDTEWPYDAMKYTILCFECAAKTSPGFKKRLERDTKNLV